MKTIPTISKVMTTFPHTVGSDIDLKKAYELMKENRYRHLPVQTAGRLVGILSDRDIKLALSFRDTEKLTVEDVMTPEPFVIEPSASLDYVLSEMAEHKYGCALISQENGKLVGIFTATDAIRVFSEMLGKFFQPKN